MTAPRHRPDPVGFTAICCGRTTCASEAGGLGDTEVVEAIRRTVRQCSHGVLVTVECLTGACEVGGGGAGRIVVVQPCDVDRRALGHAVIVGPLHEQADVDALCRWLHGGVGTPCPTHLRAGTPAVSPTRPGGP